MTTRTPVDGMGSGAAGFAGVTARLVAALSQAILEGRMVPGQRLVESDLQQQFGAGRSSVREALHQLQAQGLVTVAANKGASVRRLGRTEVRDLFVIRERLEGLAASLAATHVADGTAATRATRALSGLLDQMAKTQDAVTYGRLNRELHGALLSLAGNAELVRLVQQLSLPVFHQQFRGFLQPENQRASHAQHEVIVEAVLAGRPRAAEAAMRSHVREGLKVVLSWADDNFAPEPAD